MTIDNSRGKVKATVIIPTYKRSAFLRDTLDSILNHPQGLAYEIVVVDNAPSDDLRECVLKYNQKYKPEVRYVPEARIGLHHGRHAGARAAKSEIIIFLDDDVLVPPQWLSELVHPFRDSTVAAVGGKIVGLFPKGKEIPQWWVSIVGPCLGLLDYGQISRPMVFPEIPPGGNMAIRRSILEEVGGFNADAFADKALLKYFGDGEVGLAQKLYRKNYKIWYSASAWLFHRVPESRLSEEYLKKRARDEGIRGLFTFYRNKPYTSSLIIKSLLLSLRFIVSKILYKLSSQPDQRLIRLLAATNYFSQIQQVLRLLTDRRLRQYVTKDNFLNSIP